MEQKLATDAPYINNYAIPTWIIPVSGWGSDGMDAAYERMQAYKNVAERFNVNIEFSTRLGTFQSYKHAPSVSKEIGEHNEETFAAYEKILGTDWRKHFIEEVQKHLLK